MFPLFAGSLSRASPLRCQERKEPFSAYAQATETEGPRRVRLLAAPAYAVSSVNSLLLLRARCTSGEVVANTSETSIPSIKGHNWKDEARERGDWKTLHDETEWGWIPISGAHPINMTRIEFAAWEPDQPAYGGQQALDAQNVIPGKRGYRCMPGLAKMAKPALSSSVLGAFSMKDLSGGLITVASTEHGIFSLDGAEWAQKH